MKTSTELQHSNVVDPHHNIESVQKIRRSKLQKGTEHQKVTPAVYVTCCDTHNRILFFLFLQHKKQKIRGKLSGLSWSSFVERTEGGCKCTTAEKWWRERRRITRSWSPNRGWCRPPQSLWLAPL